MSLADKARRLLELHRPGDPVVLPTVWDAWSAKAAAAQGFAGLTVGSHPVAAARGRADNEGMSLDEMLTEVAVVTAAVDLPVSADLESGYGADPDDVVDGLLVAGAVGLNVEDTIHGEQGRRRTSEEHAAYVAALREAAGRRGVPVVINARTDALLRPSSGQSRQDALAEAIARLSAAAAAGASSLYPVGVHDDTTWRQLAYQLPLPLNALAHPGTDDLHRLRRLGVGRVSFGPRLQQALGAHADVLLSPWAPRSAGPSA